MDSLKYKKLHGGHTLQIVNTANLELKGLLHN